MSRAVKLPPPGFDELSVDEKIEYVQALWERVAADERAVPVPEWHRKILDERLADYEKAPDAGRSWNEVRDDLLARRRRDG